MTKSEKKFAKRLRHQIEDLTAGTRYTLDAKTGTVTPDDPKPKKAKKKAEEPAKKEDAADGK